MIASTIIAEIRRVEQKRKRNWEDQPECCERADVLWSVHVTDVGIIEVRALPSPEDPGLHNREYLVTVGNLFGSQTVRAFGEDKLFELLRTATRRQKKSAPRALPQGCEIVQ